MREVQESTAQDESAEAPLEDIHRLIEIVEITEVRTYEVNAARKLKRAEDETDVDEENAPIDLDFMERHTSDTLENRFKMSVEVADAAYMADIGVIYRLSEKTELAPALIAEFAERIGFMAVFPFLREAIAGMAARLGLPAPVLGIVRPGDFRITVPEELESSEPAEE